MWRYTYTAMGDVETETAPRDVVTTWRYDNLHRTETIDDGGGGATGSEAGRMRLFRKAADIAAMEEVPETRSRGWVTAIESRV